MLFFKDNTVFNYQYCLFSNISFGTWDIKKGEKNQKIFTAWYYFPKQQSQKKSKKEVRSSFFYSVFYSVMKITIYNRQLSDSDFFYGNSHREKQSLFSRQLVNVLLG